MFLRDTEHAIQAINDRQTQELPVDERELLRVAAGLGFADTASFLQQLTLHRNSVSLHFADLLAPVAEQPELQHDDADWLLLWELTLSTQEGVLLCTEKGFDQPEFNGGNGRIKGCKNVAANYSTKIKTGCAQTIGSDLPTGK